MEGADEWRLPGGGQEKRGGISAILRSDLRVGQGVSPEDHLISILSGPVTENLPEPSEFVSVVNDSHY